jgi:glycosyltransferase involved in cell wall biosynthesis
MRILNVTQSYAPFFEYGGPPAKVKALAEGLVRRGHEVTVLTADWGLDRRLAGLSNESPAEVTPFGRRRQVNGVTAIYLPNWLHYRAASWNPALGRFLREQFREFDVVHIFGLYDLLGPHVASECRRRNTPYVVEPIGMFVPIVRNILLKKLYHRIWGRKMLSAASAIIATAEQERDELLAGSIPEGKIILRRNGVEPPGTLPDRGQFRRSFPIPRNAQLILFLGRLSKKKSPDLLLRAFAGLPQTNAANNPRPHLAFVGPDESGMKARLQQLASQLDIVDRVHFSPALSGAAKWNAYRDADVFVLPSQNENFGNSAAESVAVGTPVIVTDQCGIAPLLKDKAGLVVRHDEADLRQALSRLLQDVDLRTALGEGCVRAAADLGWEQPIQDMEAVYCRLAHRAPS